MVRASSTKLQQFVDACLDGATGRAKALIDSKAVNLAAASARCVELVGQPLMLCAADADQHNLALHGPDAQGTGTLLTALLVGHRKFAALDVNESDSAGLTPLLMATHRNNTGLVRALLAAPGVDTNAGSWAGRTPLTMAAFGGHAEPLRAILGHPATDVNKRNAIGETALMSAAEGGHVECLQILLALGRPALDINAPNTEHANHTALHYACQLRDPTCAELLCATEGINVNAFAGPFDNDEWFTPLVLATTHERAGCVRALLAAPGIDANLIHETNRGFTALMWGCFNSVEGCVRALLAAPPPAESRITATNFYGGNALYGSCQEGNLPLVEALLAKDPGNVTLNQAVTLGGTDARVPNEEGFTAIHVASHFGHAQVVRALLIRGACRFHPASDGSPALAVAKNDEVREQFAAGVDYWQRKHNGRHCDAMKRVTLAVALVQQRIDSRPTAAAAALYLPPELWLLICGFLRGADFSC